MLPRISIITPSFNQGKYIGRSIASVADQQYPLLEYIIIDGGSTDDTLDIIRQHSKEISYWISEPDRGQSHAINKGLARATGEIIGWLNSDDISCPATLLRVGEFMGNHPECDAVFGGLLIIDGQDRVLNGYWPAPPDVRYTYGVALDVHQQALFWRKSLTDRIGGIDEELHYFMDLEFIIRILKAGMVGQIQQYLGALRLHEATKTSTLSALEVPEAAVIRRRFAGDFPPTILHPACRASLRLKRIAQVALAAGPAYAAFKAAHRVGLKLPVAWLGPGVSSPIWPQNTPTPSSRRTC